LAATGTTDAWGVNDTDQIVGQYVNVTGNHGFLLSGGVFFGRAQRKDTKLEDSSRLLCAR